jgi:hypothetical protein
MLKKRNILKSKTKLFSEVDLKTEFELYFCEFLQRLLEGAGSSDVERARMLSLYLLFVKKRKNIIRKKKASEEGRGQ